MAKKWVSVTLDGYNAVMAENRDLKKRLSELAAPPVAMSTPTKPVVTETEGWCPSCPCETSSGRKNCACQCHGNPFAEPEPVAGVPSGDTVLQSLDELGASGAVTEKAYIPSWLEQVLRSRIGKLEAKVIDYKAKYEETVKMLRIESEAARQFQAKYEVTQLPWLPQPDSEGWWWHKFGTHMKPLLVIRMLTLPNETSGALYIPALGVHVDYCGGEWQKVADPR